MTKIWCVATGASCNELQLYLMSDGLCVKEAYVTRIDIYFLSSGRGRVQYRERLSAQLRNEAQCVLLDSQCK